jgi:hypothetical protein
LSLSPSLHYPAVLTACLVSLALASVGSAESQAPTVVNNPAPGAATPVLRLSAQPVLRVGGTNNDDRYEFSYVTHAIRLRNGNLAVLPSSSGEHERNVEMRIFSPTGVHLRTIGRMGDGPGEFRSAARIFEVEGDSLAVVDQNRRTLTLFNTAGRTLATINRIAKTRCCFADKSLLLVPQTSSTGVVRGTSMPTSVPGATPPESTARPSWVFERTSFAAPSSRSKGITVDGDDPEIMIAPITTSDGMVGIPIERRPYGRTAFLEIAGDEVVYGIGDNFEYQVFSSSGVLKRTVRAAIPSDPVTAADRDSVRDNFTAHRRGLSRADYLSAFARLHIPATKPAYDILMTEPDGTVWIRAKAPATGQPASWVCFNTEGKLVGTLNTPPRHTVLSFAHGHVVMRASEPRSETVYLLVHRIER